MRDLDELVLECLARLEQPGADAERTLAEYATSHPEQATALRERIEALARIGLLPQPDADGYAPPDHLGDFDLHRRLGGGGMGVVYLATQRSMHRQVALKLVRPGYVFDANAQARFRREAESAARLSHPNIVPVHTFGEENGVSYLAMEYVRGASLDRVLAVLAARRDRPLRGDDFLAAVRRCTAEETGDEPPADAAFFAGSATDVALRITLALARALAHAHERGVLQRDVKPSNVMLTAGGRVVLLDFGLSSQAGGDRLTRSGAMVGSLPSMAPEQVRGDAVDERTDVYGLGVTMYELLTRASPFLVPGNPERTRQRILDGRPTPPRRIDGTVPRDAAVVCLVAMDSEAARRYPSAEAFAADLQNVIAHRPIHARPAGPWTHGSRWARRHPGAAAAVLLAALLLVGGPIVLAWQSAAARDRLQQEVQRADANRDEALAALARADENFRQARAALQRADRNFDRVLEVLDLVTRIAQDDLADVPMAEQGRRDVLRGVATFFGELAREPGSDRDLDLERAVALVRLGYVQVGLDERDDARAALVEATALFERHGTVAGTARAPDLARAHWNLARIENREGNAAKALEQFDHALALMPDGALDRAPVALERARIEAERIHTWRISGQTERARAALEELLTRLEGHPVEQHPGIAALAAWCHGEASELDGRLGRVAQRRQGLERQLELHEMLAGRDPAARGPRQELLIALSNLGSVLIDGKQIEAALPYLDRAQQLAEELIADFPGIAHYRFNLAGVLLNSSAARLQVGGDRAPEARERSRAELERAITILDRLLADDPRETDYRSHHVSASINLVVVQLQAREYEAALATLDRVDTAIAELAAIRPGDRTVVQGRIANAINRMRASLSLGRTDAACQAGLSLVEHGEPGSIAVAADLLCMVVENGAAPPDHRDLARTTARQMLAALETSAQGRDRLAAFPRLRRLQADGAPK